MSILEMQCQQPLVSPWFDLLWLSALMILINFCFLGHVALFPPDEGRYAEIAREMLSSHQFIIPHLDGVIYLEKPPLSYWVTSLVIRCFGESELGVRCAVMIPGLLGCLASYLTGRKLFNRRVGILSALMLSSTILYFTFSHMITTDMLLTFFLTCSLYAFLWAFQATSKSARDYGLWAAYLFSGLAMMTKGLIGLVFPVLIIMTFIGLTKRWSLIKDMRLFSGVLIIAVLNLPWLLAVQQKVPAFLYFYFIEQQLIRYATPIANREMALGVYISVFLLGLFPWVVWLPQSIKMLRPLQWGEPGFNSSLLFLSLWPLIILLFFSASHSILIPYLLPVLPPLTMLIGAYLDGVWLQKPNGYQRVSVMIFSGVMVIMALSLILLPMIHPLAGMKPPGNDYVVRLAAIIACLGALVAMWAAYYQSMHHLFKIMLSTAYLFLILFWAGSTPANERSIKPLALRINTLLIKHPEAKVINYGDYHQDLPYYIHRLVMIVDWQNELSFGLENQSQARTRLIDSARFWQYWDSQECVYVVMDAKVYRAMFHDGRQAYLLDQTINDVLISNKKPS